MVQRISALIAIILVMAMLSFSSTFLARHSIGYNDIARHSIGYTDNMAG